MSLTKIQALRKAAKMWEDIASETLSQERIVQKKEILEKYGENPAEGCYLCEYVDKKCGKGAHLNKSYCRMYCPIDCWGHDEEGNRVELCTDPDSTYIGWETSGNYLEAANWAEATHGILQNALKKELERRNKSIQKFMKYLTTLLVLWVACYMFGYFVLGRLIV